MPQHTRHVKYLSQHSRRHIRQSMRPAPSPAAAQARGASPAQPPLRPAGSYAWLVCGACVLLLFCTVGLGANTLTVYFPFLMQENGFSNTQISAITTIRCFVAFFGMGLAPSLGRRLGVRRLCGLACLIQALSFLVLALAHTPLLLYAAALGLGLAYGFGSMILVSILVRNWFSRREGFALGLGACGSGLANIICSPLITAAVESWGVAVAARLEAGLILLLGLVIFLVVRDDPAQVGRLPSGAEPGQTAEPAAVQGSHGVTHDAVHPRPQRRRGGQGWMERRHRGLMLAAMLLLGPCNVTVLSFFTMHYTQNGYSGMSVALGLSLYGLILTLAKLVYGWCNDHFGVYRCNYIFLGLMAASDVLIACAGLLPSGASMFIAMGLNAAGNPPSMIAPSLWARDLWPQWQYSKIVARYQQMGMIGAMLGSLLGGMAADAWGGYGPTYIAATLFTLFILGAVQFLYRRYARL